MLFNRTMPLLHQMGVAKAYALLQIGYAVFFILPFVDF